MTVQGAGEVRLQHEAVGGAVVIPPPLEPLETADVRVAEPLVIGACPRELQATLFLAVLVVWLVVLHLLASPDEILFPQLLFIALPPSIPLRLGLVNSLTGRELRLSSQSLAYPG